MRNLHWTKKDGGLETWVPGFRARILLPEPVPCRGYQKLWNLPQDVERKVNTLALNGIAC